MKDIDGICEHRFEFQLRVWNKAPRSSNHARAKYWGRRHSRPPKTTRAAGRSATLPRDRLIRCDAGLTGTPCNHAGRTTNDCKSPYQLRSASFTITTEGVHIDTFRMRFH